MELDRDAYEILQVSPKAHADVIRAAYRALAALYHPDRDGSQMSMRRMAELNAAYAELRSTDRRKAYDTARARRHSTTVTSGVASFRVTPEGGGQRDPEMLDFGRYQGWTVTQLARGRPRRCGSRVIRSASARPSHPSSSGGRRRGGSPSRHPY